MRLHHLAFRVRDLERALSFYQHALGLHIVREQTDGAGVRSSVWLALEGGVLMLERAREEEPPVDPRTLELVAFAVEPDALAPWRTKLALAGVAIEAETAYTVYFRDPEGRRVALSCHALDGHNQALRR